MDAYRQQVLAAYTVGLMSVIGRERAQRRRNMQRRRVQRSRVQELLQQGNPISHMPLLIEIRENNPNDYRNILRMDDATFQEILRLVTPLVERQNPGLRRPISAEDRLVVTLRFLATGKSLADLKFGSIISLQALELIIPETCKAIVRALKLQYCKFPTSVDEWQSIAEQFDERWNFPNCGGAISGKHVRITPPADSGSLYYNYRGFFSIVLMAVVNANYEFFFLDVGKNGKSSDGVSFNQTIFYQRLMAKSLNIPSAEETLYELNFVFVADEAFILHENIMKPYPQRALTRERRIYNYRLSRACRIVESAFGILSNRFRIFHTAINLQVDKIDWVVMACCVLHNCLQRKTPQQRPTCTVMPDEPEYPEEIARWTSLTEGFAQKASARARKVREEYLVYFNGLGAVPWQDDFIK